MEKRYAAILAALLIVFCGCTESPAADISKTNSSSTAQTSQADQQDKCVFDGNAVLEAYRSGDTSKLDEKQLAVYEKITAAISEIITADMSDYEKELAVHDFIILNTTYDEAAINALSEITTDADNPYGCLINGKSVCYGYATTFQLLMDMLDIPCNTIYAHALLGDDHSWNMVEIGGHWYYVDVCWDDSIPDFDERPVRHKYFNVSEDFMAEKHDWDTEDYPDTDSVEYSYISQIVTAVDDITQVEELMEQALLDMKDSVAVTFTDSDIADLSEADGIDNNYSPRRVKGLNSIFRDFSSRHRDYALSCQRLRNGDDIVLVIYMRKDR